MLHQLADFPHPGAIAWTRPTPEDPESHKVRILERDERNATALIAYQSIPPRDPALRRIGGAFANPASGNTRLPLTSLAATRDEALTPAPRAKASAQRSPAQRRADGKPRRSAR